LSPAPFVSPVAQEGENISSPAQEGGMRTRSQSATPPLSIVIKSVTTLRKSVREGRNHVCYYPNNSTNTNVDTAQYRSLLEPKANRDVAIAPSTIKNAGFGLFATRPLTEGSSPCSFGKCYDNALNHIVHNDTGYDDGSNFSIGNRNEDYGCWCNDPLDESLVNCTIVHDGNNHHRLKIRWDVETGEELFIEYGEDFWKEHYWKAPERVRRRYPTIVPTHPAPAEGEAHCLTPDILKFPIRLYKLLIKW
jgi:hypothetical protein